MTNSKSKENVEETLDDSMENNSEPTKAMKKSCDDELIQKVGKWFQQYYLLLHCNRQQHTRISE